MLILEETAQSEKIGKGFEKTLHKWRLKIANKHMKTWSISLIIKEMGIKTIM